MKDAIRPGVEPEPLFILFPIFNLTNTTPGNWSQEAILSGIFFSLDFTGFLLSCFLVKIAF